MRRDRREEILERTLTALKTVTMDPAINPDNVVRNMPGLSDDRRPGIILLDADEVATTTHEAPTRGLGIPGQVVAMQPQVFYLAGNLPENTTIGTHLNAARIAIMDVLVHDQELKDICGRNGYIIYGGSETDMKTGAAMEGQILVRPIMAYPFIRSELKQGD